MKITRFEDIFAWQESRKLTKLIYTLINKNIQFKNDMRFQSQISSAAVSIMSNIAEGFARQSNKEFVRFLFIAKGSLAEFQSQLYIAKDLNYIKENAFNELYKLSDQIARQISNLIKYLRTQ